MREIIVDLNFFTTAIGKHAIFTFPYIASCLVNNTNSYVELLVDDPNIITASQKDFLDNNFKHRWNLRKRPIIMNSWTYGPLLASIRWLSSPEVLCTNTYIGDIDILILENNINFVHTEHANFMNLPYSNVVREKKPKMTGCHFLKTKEWYNKIDFEYRNKIITNINNKKSTYLDEYILYKMAKEFGLPSLDKVTERDKLNTTGYYRISFRPIHGIHCSFSRPGLISWGVTEFVNKQFQILKNNELWKDAEKLFTKDYIDTVYSKIPIACEKHREWLLSRRSK